MACDARRGLLVFRVHSELLRRDFCQRTKHRWSAASGVFIEVQTNFPCAAFGWCFVGFAFEDGVANRQASFHRRILRALRCASNPSDFAKVSAELASPRNPLREMVCTVMHFTKSAAERPPRRRAQPAVGRTWLLPVT